MQRMLVPFAHNERVGPPANNIKQLADARNNIRPTLSLIDFSLYRHVTII